MSTIRISKKDGRTLLLLAEAGANLQGARVDTYALDRLRAALKPRSKPMPVEKKRAVANKRAAKSKETAEIHLAVAERAGGWCEYCTGRLTDLDPGEMDHFWGRAKAPQSVENCWLLCHSCHRAKTDNRPSRAWWLGQFGAHCIHHGYSNEAAKARRRLESLALSRASAEAGKGGGR